MLNFLFTLQAMVAERIERDDKGATAVEYGLMVALIAVVIIGAVTAIGTSLTDVFQGVADTLGFVAA